MKTQYRFSDFAGHCACLFIFLLFSVSLQGQTTITSDGLNSSSSVFVVSGGLYYTGNSGGGDRPANSPFASEGTHSYGVTNGTATLTSGDINTSDYLNISMTIKLAAFSINNTNNGVDAADYVRIDISPDGGSNYYNTLTVTGNNNAYWSYAGGTGVALTPYDGDASTVTFAPGGGGNRTTDGYSTMTITSLPSVTNLRITITMVNSSTRERFCVDDFVLSGTLLPTFYSKGSLAAQVPGNWNTQRDGSGVDATATDFTNGSRFVVQNTHTMSATAPWSISGVNSRIQVENGGILQADNGITVAAATILQVDNGGTYIHNNNSSGIWAGTEILADNSTVNYALNGAQNVEGLTYGNLTVSGGSTKTMQGSVNVNTLLNLNNGNLSLGSSNYNLTIGNGASVAGSFDNSHMIVCDGTGIVIKQDNDAASFIMIYPVGTGTYYTPMTISSFSASVASPGSISLRAVASAAPSPPGSNPLNKYWDVTTGNLNNITATVNFQYNIAEVTGNQAKYGAFLYTGGTWTIPAGAGVLGSNPFTSSGTTVLTGYWTASEVTTFYSYQSGDWANLSTWTADPSGTLWVNAGIPGSGDNVVILNGRTVTTAISRTVGSLQINAGGIIDIGNTSGHDFGTVSGEGRLRLASSIFPSGNFTLFTSSSGGTVEYYNTGSFNFDAFTFNNLIVNLANTGDIATLAGDMTIHGDLTVQQGRFQVNNGTGTSRTVSINGDVIVESSGRIQLGNGNANHRFIVNGNFINNGTVRFTNQAAPVQNSYYTSTPGNGRADVVFNNPTIDQNLTCNGQSDFYRIEIDKGIDKTYRLNINASDPAYFALYGRNDQQYYDPEGAGETINNISNNNALGLLAGTLYLGENINIPRLATYDGGSNNGVYTIDQDAMLWIDGAQVTFCNTSNWFGPVLYGTLKLSRSGLFDVTNGDNGFVMRTLGLIEIESGTFTARILRVSSRDEVSSHRGSYIQSGGTVNILGNNAIGFAASFMMPYDGMSFNMSGGILNINGVTTAGGSGTNFSFILGANPDKINVTGGALNITVPTNRNAYINSTAPFYNLNIISTSGTYYATVMNYAGNFLPNRPVVPALPLHPLIVKNDFNIQNNAVFNNSVNNIDVTVGGDFNIAAAATYTPGINTTTFNGSGTQTLDIQGTISGNFNNFTLANQTSLTINNALVTNPVIINGNLTINENTTLIDNGRTIQVAGDIYHSGTHFKPVSGAGSIQLNGTNNQAISGDGTGIFNNLTLNKSSGWVTMSSDMTVTGNLRLANTNARLNIGSNTLFLSEDASVFDGLTGTGDAFSATRMIQTNGLLSDEGINKKYSGSASSFVFPFGYYNAANSTFYYMPAIIEFTSAPAQYGTVNSRPVNSRHPLAQGTNNALNCYWKTSGTGFAGIPSGSVSHTYYYDFTGSDYFVSGTETSYIPAVFRPGASEWNYIDNVVNVNDGTNAILYDTAYVPDGEYTAGELAAFISIPVYYSRNAAPNISTTGADWENTSTWSTDPVLKWDGPAAVSVPDASSIVIIGDGTAIHKVNVTANGAQTGSLQIQENSILDIGSTINHNFGALPDSKVTGCGKLMLSSANFPTGDWGNFLGPDGGTVEYYGPNPIVLPATYLLPAGSLVNLVNYNHLILSPESANNIALPDNDLEIFGSLTADITGTYSTPAVSQFNTGSTVTLTIDGDIFVNANATLRFMNNNPQNVIVKGNIDVDATGTFDVADANGAVNNLSIYGNLINNGTVDMLASATRLCNLFFIGVNGSNIQGTTAVRTELNAITVDKGTTRDSVVNVIVNAFSLNTTLPNALTLANGTFRLTSPLTINLSTGSFILPETGCISANGGTFNIATSADDAADLLLNGRLEVLAGTINIGNSANPTNNDIEYSSGGTPEIIIRGGTLTVNGQIRRPVTINTGKLQFIQSGGTVTVSGRNADNARAMFEIVNPGSLFEMQGGTLIIARNFNNPLYNDFYVTPGTSLITGGTLQFGLAGATTAGTEFNFVTSSPLWNITMEGSVTPVVSQRIYALDLLNNLTINGSTSSYHANGLDLNIGNSLINNNTSTGTGISTGGYQPGSASQVTSFNGTAAQLITGTGTNMTNFANLVIETSASVTLSTNSEIQVNENLTLNSGTLADEGNNINVIGNIANNAIHFSSTGNGGVRLIGTGVQVISGDGNGHFGNVEIDNASGINMVDNSTINGVLNFTTGHLNINDYLLTLGSGASVSGAGSNKMIILNGVISDQGVKKIFPSGASAFTFPVGVASKYTPVTFSFSSNDASDGSIVVKPVNSKISSLTEFPALDNELSYYWFVQGQNFGSYQVTHIYEYLDVDVNGNEANYIAARYNVPTWTKLCTVPCGLINTSANTVTLTGVNYIDGEYTIGEEPNFNSIPVLYSRNARPDNNWDGTQNWSSDPVLQHAGAACNCYPQGNPVVIANGHTINLNVNNALAYSVEIQGTLNVGTTTFHSLGHVKGGGTLIITASAAGMFVFPGGEYDEFLSTAGSTVELNNPSVILPASMPLNPGNYYKPYQNLTLSGPGIKQMSSDNMRARGNITIDAGLLDNSVYNKNISLYGNWIDNNTVSSGFSPGKGKVIFEGTAAQSMLIPNSITETFYDLKIDNSAGLTITGANGKASISHFLYLTQGNITTNSTNTLTITNTSNAAAIGGGSSSFVDGPLYKNILNSGSFIFPVGDNTRYGCITLSGTNGPSSPSLWGVSYFDSNPSPTYPTDAVNLNPPVTSVSDNEYWVVSRPGGTGTANISLRWDAASYPSYTGDPLLRSRLRVVEFESAGPDLWTERGWNVSGNAVSGTVSTTTPVTQDDYVFTIGVSGVTATINTPPLTYNICDNGEIASIPVTLTGTPPWTLSYRTVGNSITRNFIQTGILSSDYTIQLTGSDMGGAGAAPYTLSLVSVSDNAAPGIVNATTVDITVDSSYVPDIIGTFTVGAGEVRQFSTVSHASTYSWSWVGASGGTFNTATSNPTDITIATPGSYPTVYQLQVEETTISTGCVASDIQAITVIDVPAPVITPTTANVCEGSTVTYSTPVVGTDTYTWTVTGGTPATGTGPSIDVTWGIAGPGTVSVDENRSGVHGYDMNNYTISSAITTYTATAQSPSVCLGAGTNILLSGSQSGVSYQLRDNATHINIGSPVAGTGAALSLPTGNLAINTTFEVYAYNSGCSQLMNGTPAVTILPLPGAAGIINGDPSVCQGDTGVSYSVPPVTDASGYIWSYSGTGATINGSGISVTIDFSSAATSGNLTVYGTNACGDGTISSDYPISVNTSPTAVLTVTDNSGLASDDGIICSGDSATLTASGGTSYSWSSGETTAIIEKGATGTYTVTVTSVNGCSDVDSATITVNPLPTASIAITDNSGTANNDGIICSGDNATLTASGGTSYSWSSGESTAAIIKSATGTYTVTVTDANGCTDTDAADITVNLLPVTSVISGNSSPVCYEEDVSYAVTLSTGSKYQWNLPASATITSDTTGLEKNSIVVSFGSVSGAITVVETNEYGCTGDVQTLDIQLQGCNLVADFSADKTSICQGDTVTFTNLSQGTGITTQYQWSFGSGAEPPSATGEGPCQVTYSQAGLKTVSLVITDGLTDTLTLTDYISVNIIPSASIHEESICGEGLIEFIVEENLGFDRVEFSTDTTSTQVDKDITVPYSHSEYLQENDSVMIWAKVFNSETGCVSSWIESNWGKSYPVPDPIIILNHQKPDEEYQDYVDILCTNAVGSYTAVKSTGSTITWNIPSLNIQDEITEILEVFWDVEPGDYNITAIETNTYGCQGPLSEAFVHISVPDVSIGEDTAICQGESHTFVTNETFQSYEWQDGSSRPTFTTGDAGMVKVTVTDDYGCTASDSAMLFIHEGPVLNLGSDTVLCGTGAYRLEAPGFYQYQWSTGETNSYIFVYAGRQTISLTVTDANGCTDTDTILIIECSPVNLLGEITNAFTPNEDGSHDEWVINNIDLFPNAKIEVFDRWGRLVFNINGGYKNDWKGTFNGKDLPVDTYYYVIDLNVPGSEPLTGTVTIIR
jgi:gliding motility-associated-like protein